MFVRDQRCLRLRFARVPHPSPLLRRVGYAAETAKAFGLLLFASGEEAEQVAVGLGAESFRAVAVVMQKAGREGAPRMLAVFDFKAVERGQGNAVSAVEMAERFKEIGFQLMVRVGRSVWVGVVVAPVDWSV